jgi:hypothetical protein
VVQASKRESPQRRYGAKSDSFFASLRHCGSSFKGTRLKCAIAQRIVSSWRPLLLGGSSTSLYPLQVKSTPYSLIHSTSQLIGIGKGTSVRSQSCQIKALTSAKVASFKHFSIVPHGTKVEQ